MSFLSLEQIFNQIQAQPEWRKYKKYTEIRKYWDKVVSSKAVSHSQPVFIQKDILWVATSSSTWAQELNLQRYQLCQQLNRLIADNLVDIRFSPAYWQQVQLNLAPNPAQASVSQQHPSLIDVSLLDLSALEPSQVTTPLQAYQNWLKAYKQITKNLPLCPQCSCPTPPGELERYSICSHCIRDV